MMFMTRFEIVGQHVQGHFSADPFERLHLEVGSAHPVFDGPEWMLDGFAPLAHLLRMRVEPPLDGFEEGFVFPAGDPALLARGAAILDRAGLAGIGPGAAQGQPLFLVCEVVDQALTGRAPIDILIGQVDEVLLAKPAPFATLGPLLPEVSGLGSVTVMPAFLHARISLPLK